jgi:hypothetical protein
MLRCKKTSVLALLLACATLLLAGCAPPASPPPAEDTLPPISAELPPDVYCLVYLEHIGNDGSHLVSPKRCGPCRDLLAYLCARQGAPGVTVTIGPPVTGLIPGYHIKFIQLDDTAYGYRTIAEVLFISSERIHVQRHDSDQPERTFQFQPDPEFQRLLRAIHPLEMDELIDDLSCDIAPLRRSAAQVLGSDCKLQGGRLGAHWGRAVTALRTHLHDPVPLVRSRVAASLVQLDGQDDEVAAVVGRLLQAEDEYVRFESADTVGKLGTHAASLLPNLINNLSTNVVNVRYGCIKALGNIGAEAKSALPALERYLHDESGYVMREAASEAIRKIRAADK